MVFTDEDRIAMGREFGEAFTWEVDTYRLVGSVELGHKTRLEVVLTKLPERNGRHSYNVLVRLAERRVRADGPSNSRVIRLIDDPPYHPTRKRAIDAAIARWKVVSELLPEAMEALDLPDQYSLLNGKGRP